jgi:hypothetical protein
MTPYELGRTARLNGAPITNNPFDILTDEKRNFEWDDGWKEALDDE